MKGKGILLALVVALAIPVTAGASDAKLSTLGLSILDSTKAFQRCHDTGTVPHSMTCVNRALGIMKGEGAMLRYLNTRITRGSIRGGTTCGKATNRLMHVPGPDLVIGDWIGGAATKNDILGAQIKFINQMVKVYEVC